jgi:hypothetical protein
MMKKAVMSLVVLGVAGCASVQLPPERLEHSEAGIRSANEVGAQNVPEAKLLVQLAKDETESAKKMAAGGDDKAVSMLARADADAELALVLAREASVHADAVKAGEELKAVQSRTAP